MTTLLVSTRNAHKLGEIKKILGDGFYLLGLDAIKAFPDVEETGATFEENAALKALAASERLCDSYTGYVIADDSGLEVDALDGAPGVYSARFAGEPANDTANNALLLEKLQGEKNRCARFRCVITLALGKKILATFDGCVEGHIAETPSGAGGFGYDPLFIPEGHSESFAVLPAEIKNSMSHRARALEKLKEYFDNLVEPPVIDEACKKKPSLVQKFFAGEGIDRLFLYLCITGGIIAVILASIACQISLQMLGNWQFLMWYLLSILFVAPLGFMLTLLSCAFWGPPLFAFIAFLNGAPFHVGDRVQIIAGKYAGTVTTIYGRGWGNGGGIVWLLRLGKEADKAHEDAFSASQIMRV